MSFEVSVTVPISKRTLAGLTLTVTFSVLSSIRRCSSCTVFLGMMTPGMPSEPLGRGSSACASRCPSVATARSIGVLPLSAMWRKIPLR